MNDLTAMEKYIAESYMRRSLIELLQNADETNASKFYITKPPPAEAGGFGVADETA